MKHILTTAILVAAACLTVACSNFERDWSREVSGSKPRPVSAVPGARRLPPEGAWIGTWHSEGTGHAGALRCLVVQPSDRTGSQGWWSFRYHAHWGLLSGEFRTLQPVRPPSAGVFVSRGDWTVPRWAGGTYHYEIEITSAGFHGTYKGGGDHGTFSMKRPAPL